ncbi:MAG TPA: RnfABCDGE type electron transport complex subunit D [Tepidisphaeraceae bacterium]|jgi:hypothetical protein
MASWRFDRDHLNHLRLASGMILPAVAALGLFGWRAAGVVALVVLGALLADELLPRGPRPARLRVMVRAALIAAFLPATLFDLDSALSRIESLWPVAVAAGVLFVLVDWVIYSIATARASAIVVTLLLLIGLVPAALQTDRVLPRNEAFAGDLLSARTVSRQISTAEPWLDTLQDEEGVVFTLPQATQGLDDYLHGRMATDRPAVTIARLVGDDLPPLEDLVVGGQPRPIGTASAIAVVIGGLFLVHRGMMPLRVPVLMTLTLCLTLAVLPLPVIVSHDAIVRRWLAMMDSRVGLAAGVTFVNYLLLASPAMLVTFFLASQPESCPPGRSGGIAFSVLYGVLAAVFISRVSVEHGPLFALAVAQLATPTLQRWNSPRHLPAAEPAPGI